MGKKVDNSPCLTSLDDKKGCDNVEMDRDNDKGGHDGPEIVTFQDRKVNSLYTYLVAVEEYFVGIDTENGANFLKSGVRITLESNNVTQTITMNEKANQTITKPNSFYFFGCL